ncbi:MAG TPA: glycerate kinase [Nocardioidaceae bacterium]|nr:glycerate kinase [Nocardioidaceae bacterium]
MRVLIAPDKFAGTLSAVEAAAAIAEGWRRRAPGDEVVQVPMADGGPGFCDVLHAGLGGDLLAVTVTGPYGAPLPATVLLVGDTAYVESAQACGLHLTPQAERDPERATSHGVGELLAAAVDAGARRVVVGLGGSATNDGGAGMLAALGATADAPLTEGPGGLDGVTRVDLAAVRARMEGVELVAASDVDNPLLGLTGATNVYGPQKGVREERKQALDAALEALAEATDRRTANTKGAGAAGGLGFGLLLLGATRTPGVDLVADAVDLAGHAAAVDLVVTGEGAFDFQSRSGKVAYGVANVAGRALRPCIAVAGQVLVGSREMRAMGVESAYSVVDLVGEEAAFGRPRESLARLAERVARTWSADR